MRLIALTIKVWLKTILKENKNEKKTKGLFHYEEETWEQFFSKKQVVKHSKKLSICMKDKNYQFFCDCLFNAFDNLYKKRA